MDPVLGRLMSSVLKVVPLLGKRAATEIDRRRLRATIDSIGQSRSDSLLKALSPDDARRVNEFVKSAQFDHVVFHATIAAMTKPNEETFGAIRGMIREGLRHAGIADAFLTTELADQLSADLRVIASTLAREKALTANAAKVTAHAAAAAVRSSRQLAVIGELTEFQEFASRLRSQVARATRKLRLNHAGHPEPVRRERLYVGPELRLESDPLRKFSLEYVVGTHLRTTILGDPGAGKSTAASQIVYMLASEQGPQSRVPFLFTVRDHIEDIRTKTYDIKRYLEASCTYPYGIEAPAGAIEYLLNTGSATVIVDGVDELGDARHRLRLVAILESFANLYPLTQIIVTSRGSRLSRSRARSRALR